MIDSDHTSRSGILESGAGDGSDAQRDSLIHSEVPPVLRVEHTVRKCASRSDSEELPSQSGGIVIDVVQRGAGLVRAREHRAHGQPVALVLPHDAAEHHGGDGHRGLLSVSQFVESALHRNVFLPELAIGGTTGHGTQDEVIDLDDFADVVRTDEGSHGGSGIDSDQDASLELEGQSGGTLGEVGHLRSQLLHVSLELDLVLYWVHFEAEALRPDFVLSDGLAGLLFNFGLLGLLQTGTWSDEAERRCREGLGQAKVFIIQVGAVHLESKVEVSIKHFHL